MEKKIDYSVKNDNIIVAFLEEQGIAYVEESERMISFEIDENTYQVGYNNLSPQFISVGLFYTCDALDRGSILHVLNEANSRFMMTKCSLVGDDKIVVSIDMIVASASQLADVFYAYIDMILRTAGNTANDMKMIVDGVCMDDDSTFNCYDNKLS